jgi:hypothetical protein
MKVHAFELVPLPDPKIPEIRLTGSVAKAGKALTLNYSLSGQIDDILFPELNAQPGRKSGLWQATCFEFFLAFPGQPHYWEFNISPSGDWNVFRMDSYRQVGFREEELIQNPQMDIKQDAKCFQLQVVTDLGRILEANEKIIVGVSCVVKTHDGHETYWAVKHITPQADFHMRESFILVLEE